MTRVLTHVSLRWPQAPSGSWQHLLGSANSAVRRRRLHTRYHASLSSTSDGSMLLCGASAANLRGCPRRLPKESWCWSVPGFCGLMCVWTFWTEVKFLQKWWGGRLGLAAPTCLLLHANDMIQQISTHEGFLFSFEERVVHHLDENLSCLNKSFFQCCCVDEVWAKAWNARIAQVATWAGLCLPQARVMVTSTQARTIWWLDWR